MIGNSNYIETCLNGLIQNQELNELNPFQFLQISSILLIMMEQPILLVILNWLHWIMLIFMKEKIYMKNMENEMKEINEKIVEKPYKDDVNFDEAIPMQIIKERTTK